MAVDDLIQLYNPWLLQPDRQTELLRQRLPGRFIERDVHLEDQVDKALLVIGPRQAGKSTLILDAASKQARPLVVVNLEEPALRDLCRSPAEFVVWLRRIVALPASVVLEEVQHLAEPGLFIKGLVDLRTGHAITATGSSSYHLRAKTRESLAGRAIRVRVLPLSLSEIATQSTDTLAGRASARAAWRRQLVHGCYPAVWQSDKPELELARLAEAFVIRDASDLYAVRDLRRFRTLLRLVAADSGNLINVSNLASETGVSRITVSRWLDLLEETHVITRLAPFLGGKRAEIKSATKAYFLDCGLRNTVFGGFGEPGNRADIGQLAEGWALGEIQKTIGLLDSIRFWRTNHGTEVDFVVDRGATRIAIEVKAEALTKPRLPRSARTFVELYRPDRLVVVNAELDVDAEHAGVPVLYRPPWRLRSAIQ